MESESCGTRCVQFILFMLNFIFFLCGIGLVVVSFFLWLAPFQTVFNYNIVELADILGNVYLEAGCFIMMAAGVVIIFFSIVGCCGAFLLSRVLLGLYFLIILLLFFAQLAGAILAALYSVEISEFTETKAKTLLIENYKYNSNDSFSAAIDKFQELKQCCGILASTDYDEVEDEKPVGVLWPASCCVDPDQDPCTNVHGDACGDAFEILLTENTTIIGATLVGVACLELFLMVFSVLLCRNASEKDDY